jgi:hypothetical protein
MTRYEAKKYSAYARECLRLAETADDTDKRQKLIELSRVWMEAALNEERLHRQEQLRSSEEPTAAHCLPGA